MGRIRHSVKRRVKAKVRVKKRAKQGSAKQKREGTKERKKLTVCGNCPLFQKGSLNCMSRSVCRRESTEMRLRKKLGRR
jgi:hypothetical protein